MMGKFIVVCTFKDAVAREEIAALVPAERAAAAALQERGAIGAIHLGMPRRTVFIEVNASNVAMAEQIVRELPMAGLWDLDLFEIVPPAVAAA